MIQFSVSPPSSPPSRSMSTTSHDSFTDSHGSDGLLSKIRRMGSAVFTTTDEHPAVIELHRAERRKRRPSEGTTASSRLRRLALLESALIRSFSKNNDFPFVSSTYALLSLQQIVIDQRHSKNTSNRSVRPLRHSQQPISDHSPSPPSPN